MKHKTVTITLDPTESYSESAMLNMALDKSGITMSELRSHEILTSTPTKAKIVLWFDKD